MRLMRAGLAVAVAAWGLASTGIAAADLAVNPDGHTVYLTDLHHPNVAVIDGSTGAVTATIPVGGIQASLVVDPGTQTLYVAAAEVVSVIDAATLDIKANVVLEGPVVDLAVDPSTHAVYAAHRSTNASGVSVIDGVTRTVVSTIPVDEPAQIAVDPGTNTIYVTTTEFCGNVACLRDSRWMTAIDGTTRTVFPHVGSFVTVDPLTHTAYTANSTEDAVSVIQGPTHAVVATIPVGHRPGSITVDPGTRTVYVLNGGDNTVSVIDGETRTVTRTVPVAKRASAVEVDPVTHIVYVQNDGTLATLPRG